MRAAIRSFWPAAEADLLASVSVASTAARNHKKRTRRCYGEAMATLADRSLHLSLEERALALLSGNTQAAEWGGRRFRFSVPSVRAYPFQWFWDSCFHAIVWSRRDPERAADELRALFAWQEDTGLIPHVVFWDKAKVSRLAWHYLESRSNGLPFSPKPRTTACIQPPVIAQAVERVVAAGVDGDFTAEALPALERYYRFLAAARDPDGDGLISIISQFESGLDFSPAYDDLTRPRGRHPFSLHCRARLPQVANKLLSFDVDAIVRRFRHHVEDVLVNALYGQGLRALARLAERTERPELAQWANRTADAVTASLLERCFDEKRGLFFNVSGPDERRARVKTVHALIPLVLPDLPREVAAALVERLTDPRTFWAPYPVPSVALDESSFRPSHRVWGCRFIWRGPASLNTNWLLVHGLRAHGYRDIAESIAARSRDLVERTGFNEFYNPLTGAPVGAERFGWATLASDL
jgi:glycogen debranching enzyme